MAKGSRAPLRGTTAFDTNANDVWGVHSESYAATQTPVPQQNLRLTPRNAPCPHVDQ